ncbi:histidine phosphatase family protein [Kordiimonas sp. SCSIO 12603]|uniref:SixA phosphatase family protein n=1 Tax=Kordiimonas sp. SCSIO 12603 TaxID=2829596 RepID=UPI002104B5D3|nr:phosphoglycerate mutase family protein [Kordiimonas sp. SCSIO 12603]UTW58485.1 histidine phosphatase family protein [Kordiimonas sp. SCSIO 12603]
MKLKTLCLSVAVTFAATMSAAAFDSTFYLVRHAEKQADHNPPLTEAGVKRAKAIAEKLKGKKLNAVYSTDYTRTLQTAEPTAKQHKLDITKYDPRKLKDFAVELKNLEGTYLVVGHSNTTPYLASLLIGEKLPMLNEKQYDRVYIVHIDNDGKASLSMDYTEPRTE